MERYTAVSPGARTGVLVLAGSSGRIESQRCDLLARHGVTAMSVRWFGGAGQPPGICEVPLETFVAALDLLAQTGVSRLAVLGSSKGAEAALTLACLEPRVDAVVALSPSSVVWADVAPYPAEWPDHGPAPTSCWSRARTTRCGRLRRSCTGDPPRLTRPWERRPGRTSWLCSVHDRRNT
ncbi:acyl-CoA thioester hydrolase/BAAT C-terminal domain-containing protein [Nonomuraea rhodomycinica]|uniref:acyl-CoA thioester hydrolase/BAAT C-terminal domain-containing protein n=1 Tax=Nonomuraea rhodomycinica TaxID=1712872 RepID=UPI001C3768C0|nr:acyl-CoA thioester hydrolase/BAAT C-terminal domain-containing protein [Nonomuraea rhodomycinica]